LKLTETALNILWLNFYNGCSTKHF